MSEAKPLPHPPELITDMPVGEILRRGREHYGQSLQDVERFLRIRAAQLHALETGKNELLPGKTYALGFVRSYSEYLGLDGEKMVQLYKKQSGGGPKIETNLTYAAPASDGKIPAFALALVCVVAGIFFTVNYVSEKNEDNSDITAIPALEEPLAPAQEAAANAALPALQPPANGAPASAQTTAVAGVTDGTLVSAAQPVDPAGAAAADLAATQGVAPVESAPMAATDAADSVSGAAQPDPTAMAGAVSGTVPAAGVDQAGATQSPQQPAQTPPAAETAQAAMPEASIILNVVENSWVEIRDSEGNPIVSRVLKEGDQYFVPDRPDLSMSLGNAAGVQISVDGKTLPFLGRRGEVRRNIALDSKALKALAAPQ